MSNTIKFKVYDPELKRFIVDSELSDKISSTNDLKRYFLIYGEDGIILGFHQENGDWSECKIFVHSGFCDFIGKDLYFGDKIKHHDFDITGVIDIEYGKWVVRYDTSRTALLADRSEHLLLVGDPTV